MTKEVAIEILQGAIKKPNTKDGYLGQAIDMAIRALSQEPTTTSTDEPMTMVYPTIVCEDAISREAVLNLLDGYIAVLNLLDRDIFASWIEIELEGKIKKLPPITQKSGKYAEPKTGHWIMPVQDDGMSEPICYQVQCSECGFDLDPQTWHMELHQYGADKYCPNCGACMKERRTLDEFIEDSERKNEKCMDIIR